MNHSNIKQCSCCLENIYQNDSSITKCAHKFHTSCLVKWVATGKNTCPLCREILSDQITNNSNNPNNPNNLAIIHINRVYRIHHTLMFNVYQQRLSRNIIVLGGILILLLVFIV